MNKQIVITVKIPEGVTEEEVNDYINSLLATLSQSKSHVFFRSNNGRKTRSVEVGNVVKHTWDYLNDTKVEK